MIIFFFTYEAIIVIIIFILALLVGSASALASIMSTIATITVIACAIFVLVTFVQSVAEGPIEGLAYIVRSILLCYIIHSKIAGCSIADENSFFSYLGFVFHAAVVMTGTMIFMGLNWVLHEFLTDSIILSLLSIVLSVLLFYHLYV